MEPCPISEIEGHYWSNSDPWPEDLSNPEVLRFFCKINQSQNLSFVCPCVQMCMSACVLYIHCVFIEAWGRYPVLNTTHLIPLRQDLTLNQAQQASQTLLSLSLMLLGKMVNKDANLNRNMLNRKIDYYEIV